MNFGELIAKGGALFARKGADALADTLETASPADLARIQSSVSGDYEGVLRHWFSGGSLAGKKLAIVGDSTAYQIFQVAQNLGYLNKAYINNPGSGLYGVTLQNFGSNGNTIENFLNGIPAGVGIADVIAATPDLVIFNYGINSVRLQASALTAQGLADKIRQAINQIRAALPNCDFILRVPNSLLTTDVGGFGYVVPTAGTTVAQWAQSASDILRDAYRAVRYEWDNCVTWDSRADAFPDTSPASHVYMVDQLHPTSVPFGYKAIIDGMLSLCVRPAAYNAGSAQNALAAGYADAHTRYPLVVRGPMYDTLSEGDWSGSAGSYIDFSAPLTAIGGFMPGDIVLQNGVYAFSLPSSFSNFASSNNIRISGLGTLVQTQTGGKVSVHRRKYGAFAAGADYIVPGGSQRYPFVVRGVSYAAGPGYLRLEKYLPTDKAAPIFSIRAGDIVLHPTLGAVTITGTLSEFSNNTIALSQAGDWTLPAGVNDLFVVGAQQRELTQSVLKFFAAGALTATTIRDIPTVGGVYSVASASLGTAGTTATTVTVARNGTTVLTLTFSAGSTSPTLAWASGTQFCTLAGRTFTATVSPGAGAADLAIAVSA